MIKCLGSGSKGNGWILDDGKEILVIDCGVPVKDMKIAIGFQISRVVGCAVSHGHKDHAGYINQYEGCGLQVYKPYETIEDIGYARFGSFFIQSFPLAHDVPCFGFLVSNPTLGRILYATDTEYIKYRFKNLNYIIDEANYANDLLDDEVTDDTKRTHVLRGHMELETTKRFLQQNVDENTRAVVLAHLSTENADPDLFVAEVESVLSPFSAIAVAKKGMVIRDGS